MKPIMTFLDIDQAAAALRAGGVVVLPTDTVYGLGLSVRAADGPHELFRLKGRPGGKPVAWLVGGPDALDCYGDEVRPWVRRLAERFWPGALTLVVRASEAVPPAFRSQAGTIGLRMPASPAPLSLIRAAGSPLAVTSANMSGCPAVACADDLDATLVAGTEGVLKGACPSGGVASTVVDCTGDALVILRQGALSSSDLKGCCS